MMTFQQLYQSLLPLYDMGEARAVVRLLLEEGFQMSRADQLTGGLDSLSTAQKSALSAMMDRLRAGEPVQYVLGRASFGGRQFHVAPGVLIPRPETEELVEAVCREYYQPVCPLCVPPPLQVLDVGTGSGCIAVTLALDLQGAAVTAWDISADALLIARENAHSLGADVNFQLQDALQPPHDEHRWDVIVSNPPYIADEERKDMEPRVLDHEPSTALFVPDDDPLRFYRAIASYGQAALKPGGRLFFEINPRFASQMQEMLCQMGYQDVAIRRDDQGKERMAMARKRMTQVSQAQFLGELSGVKGS